MNKADKVILGIITGVGAFFGIRYLMRAAPEVTRIELVSASWGKDVYSPNETATLTANFRNPTSKACDYITIARYTDPYSKNITFRQDFSLNAGEEISVSYIFTAPDSTKFVYIEAYCQENLLQTFRAPDMVVAPPVVGAAFIMLGGINNEANWVGDLETGYYVKTGDVINVGDAEGTQEVVGWWRVGNYGQVYESKKMNITLGPGQKQTFSFTITAQEMIDAQIAAGKLKIIVDHWRHIVGYPDFCMAFISTPDQAHYATEYGWLYTSDIVHLPPEYVDIPLYPM